jgi:hypothetical protein
MSKIQRVMIGERAGVFIPDEEMAEVLVEMAGLVWTANGGGVPTLDAFADALKLPPVKYVGLDADWVGHRHTSESDVFNAACAILRAQAAAIQRRSMEPSPYLHPRVEGRLSTVGVRLELPDVSE